jgi:hypothetical protein
MTIFTDNYFLVANVLKLGAQANGSAPWAAKSARDEIVTF